jgi:hypothetical protein
MKIAILLFILLIAAISSAAPSMKIAFLPFEDKARLKGTWDLSVDIPRWFSQTVDTIEAHDSAVRTISFDTTLSLIRKNGWKRAEYLSPALMEKIALYTGADYVVSGTITRFKLIKRSANAKAPFDASTDVAKSSWGESWGEGGVTVIAGFASFSANVAIAVDIFSRATRTIDHLPLDSRDKDAGFKTWLNFQLQNSETDFSRMEDEPFGAAAFQRTIAGAVMKQFSLKLKNRLIEIAAKPISLAVGKEFVRGKILERNGRDVYLDLGSADFVIQGEALEVLKPDHPLLGDKGDTLGWSDKPVGTIKVRFVKAQHFSQAIIVEETDTIRTGWSVQPVLKK